MGSVLAVFLADNAYEEFAEHSFLGESGNKIEAYRQFSWAPDGYVLPTNDRGREMQALIALLSNFRTDAFFRTDASIGQDSFSRNSVRIFPGYYRDGDKFEVYFLLRYNDSRQPLIVFRAEIDLTTGDIRQTAGNWLLPESSFIHYDDTGRVKAIEVPIFEKYIPSPGLLFESQMMWIRLISKDGLTAPLRDAARKDVWHTSYMDFNLGNPLGGSSLQARARGSSLDPDHRATSENNPPPYNLLEEIK